MKSIIRHSLVATIAFAAAATVANAQDTGAPSPERPRAGEARGDMRGPGRPAALVAALDADKDGEISADELKNAEAALKTLDKNNDGKLTPDEFRPPAGRGPREGEGSRPEANPEQRATRMMQADKNGDGKLSKDELLPEFLARMIERGDTDKDGCLSKDELVKALESENAARAERRARQRGQGDEAGAKEGGDKPAGEEAKPAAGETIPVPGTTK